MKIWKQSLNHEVKGVDDMYGIQMSPPRTVQRGKAIDVNDCITSTCLARINEHSDLYHRSDLYGLPSSFFGESSSTMLFGSFHASATYFV